MVLPVILFILLYIVINIMAKNLVKKLTNNLRNSEALAPKIAISYPTLSTVDPKVLVLPETRMKTKTNMQHTKKK